MSDNHLTRREFVKSSTAAGVTLAVGSNVSFGKKVDTSQIVNYNSNMEYRPLGKTGLMVSAVCLGGHWKRLDKEIPGVFRGGKWLNADLDSPDFKKNRRAVVEHLIENGINYIDACTREECMAYGEALTGIRDKMHLGFSWYQEEMRKPDFRTEKALLGTLEKGMKESKVDYVDLWRITMISRSSKHTEGEIEEMMKALVKAKEQGKARFTGLSSHDRPHIKHMIEKYPEVVDVFVTPYTAKTKELPSDSVFESARKNKVGMFGIKPYASGSLFKGDGTPGNPKAEEDNRLARMAIRYILHNDAVTAPIPGMINTDQVDNAAQAIRERRELDLAEANDLRVAMDDAFARLPRSYQWLKDWECA